MDKNCEWLDLENSIDILKKKERRMWYLDTDAYELYCPRHDHSLWLLRPDTFPSPNRCPLSHCINRHSLDLCYFKSKDFKSEFGIFRPLKKSVGICIWKMPCHRRHTQCRFHTPIVL